MKVVTILGTRPEIIRLSLIVKELEPFCRHVLVHTGQNFDHGLSGIFLEELGLKVHHDLGVAADTFGGQIGKIIEASERVLLLERPDRVLVLGDTNSALAAIVAKRLGIRVYHMEAGNRCYDDRVPEEVNRRIVDHSSDVLLAYTERSRLNLLHEGIGNARIHVVGNPIGEVIQRHEPSISPSDVLRRLGLTADKYFLATMHREENVDVESRLRSLVRAFGMVGEKYGLPIVCSLHPRTKRRIESLGLADKGTNVLFHPPFGFFDFIALERSAFCVLSDSGTVQEECCLFRVPNVTIRDVTERPETIDCGANILGGTDPETIMQCVHLATTQARDWTIPAEYQIGNVSQTVAKIVLGQC